MQLRSSRSPDPRTRQLTWLAALLALIALVLGALIALPRLRPQAAEESPGTPPPTAEGAAASTEAPALAPGEPTPMPTPAAFEHVVEAGESLNAVAALYDIPVEALGAANNLNPTAPISEGQALVIPLPPSRAGRWHDVQPGESLIAIADMYGADPEAVIRANNLADGATIFSGQRLRIPGVEPPLAEYPRPVGPGAPPGGPTGFSGRVVHRPWPRSTVEKGLEEGYPLAFEHDRFTLHYQPGTYTALNRDDVVALAETALGHVETWLGVTMPDRFDLYVAGTPFEDPYGALRGWSFSSDKRVYVLHDGTGTETDNLYFFVHELTHLVAATAWGKPGSPLLSEGLATAAGKDILEGGGYLPYNEICTALYAAGEMPAMADLAAEPAAFEGHLRYPFNYFGAGCFVGYLVELRGIDALRTAYPAPDYPAQFGQPLADLDAAWRAGLGAQVPTLHTNPADLVMLAGDLDRLYETVFERYAATDAMQLAYEAADQARVALWKGEFAATREWVAAAYELMGIQP